MEIGKTLQGAWQLFKRNPGKLILIYFVFFLVNLGAGVVLSFIPLVGGILSSIVGIILGAGVYYAYLRFYREGDASIDDIFFPMKQNAGELAIMAVIKSIFLILGFILLVLPGIYLAVSYIFAELLIVDKNLTAWEALETSRKRVTKNWFVYFAFLLILLFINIIGLIPLGLGLFVTVPVSFMAITLAYVAEFCTDAEVDNGESHSSVN